MTHELTGNPLMNDTWTDISTGGERFAAVNPATGAALQPPFSEAGDDEVRCACGHAAVAFERALELPPRWSADYLDTIAANIMDLGDALLERAEAETALPRPRLVGERLRTVNQLKMFASIVRDGSWVDAVIDTADPKRTPAAKPDLRRMLRPRGAVAVFGASNFPFAFGAVGGDTASALAAGCAVVVKGHPSHPGTSELFAAAVSAATEKLKLPWGLFSLLQGRRHELSALLVTNPDIAAVGFTGSAKAGRALFNLAAARPNPIPVFAEMGSLNPLVIFPGAMKERAEQIAADLSASVLLGGGQFCTKPGLIVTIGKSHEKLVSALCDKLAAAAPSTLLNRGLCESFATRVREFAGVKGVNAVVPAAASAAGTASPTLFETDWHTWDDNPSLHEEAFGPATIIVHVDDASEAGLLIERLGGSLTGTLHLGSEEDKSDVAHVVRKIESAAGRVIFNGYPTGVEVNNAIVHGGPYPATTDPGTTSVGSAAIRRWVRLIAYQDTPDALLPAALQNSNPLGIERIINGTRTREALTQSSTR